MHSTRLAKVAVAVTLPLMGVAAVSGNAGAAPKAVTAIGNVTCSYSDTISFNPPLAPGAGTPGYALETVTIAPATLSGCSGSADPGVIPTSGAVLRAKSFKIKGVRIGRVYKAGACQSFQELAWPELRPTIAWTSTGVNLKSTHVSSFTGEGTTNPVNGNLGVIFSGNDSSSFAGASTISAYYDTASSDAMVNCLGGSGTVSSLTIDPTVSTISLG
ncbi:MAG: hypothetical protein ABSF84_12250 [Acidimicrobiales bacterium]|jgi:hypothetical protein